MARLQEFYKEKVVADLTSKFSYKSSMEVPRLLKITLNMGVGEAIADKKVLEHAVGDLTKIAGQKPVTTKSRKAIAGFKIREGYPIGCTKKGATIIKKVLESAIANAEHNDGADIDELIVKTIYVEKGPILKRFTARAKGRGDRISKQSCHIYVTVGN